jgi:hypothetical protein
MLGTFQSSAEAVRRARALSGSPACFGRRGNGTSPWISISQSARSINEVNGVTRFTSCPSFRLQRRFAALTANRTYQATRHDYRQGFLVARRHFLTAASDTGTNAGNDPATPDVGQTYNNRGQLVNAITTYTANHPDTRVVYVYGVRVHRLTC